MTRIVLDRGMIRDIAPDVLDAEGQLRVMPAAYYRSTTLEERALLGVRHGLYGLPTQELIDWLIDKINGRCAIEIGAGHGALARALGIVATDSRLQEAPHIAAYYAALGQPVVQYGAQVQKLDAAEAIAHHRPQVVIASWVTQRCQDAHVGAVGSVFGVDEAAVIADVETYILIGNTNVHAHKVIWALPHERLTPDWLFSRAFNGSADFIAIWGE